MLFEMMARRKVRDHQPCGLGKVNAARDGGGSVEPRGGDLREAATPHVEQGAEDAVASAEPVGCHFDGPRHLAARDARQ